MKATLLASILFFVGCSPAQLDQAKTVAEDLWKVARVLCLRAQAEKAGVSIQDVANTVCSTRADLEPWIQPILGAQRAGAAKAGIAP